MALNERLEEARRSAKGGLAQTLDGHPQIDETPGCCLIQDAKEPSDSEPAFGGKLPGSLLVEDDQVGSQCLGQDDRLTFSGMNAIPLRCSPIYSMIQTVLMFTNSRMPKTPSSRP